MHARHEAAVRIALAELARDPPPDRDLDEVIADRLLAREPAAERLIELLTGASVRTSQEGSRSA